MTDATSQSRFFAELKKQWWFHLLFAIVFILDRLDLIKLSDSIDTSWGLLYFLLILLLIFILPLAFLFFSWAALHAVFTKNPLSPREYREVFFTLALVFTILFSIVLTKASAPVLPYMLEEYRFNPEIWKNDRLVRGKALMFRQKMLYDAIRTARELKEKKKVLGIFGPSIETDRTFLWEGNRTPDMIYWLGPQRNFPGLDSEWLLIWFDSSGIFERYSIEVD